MTSWCVTIACTRAEADAAARADDPFPGFDPPPTLVACEANDSWALQLFCEEAPAPALLAVFAALAPSSERVPDVEQLAEADWVRLSQAGLEPADIGRFHVHTADQAGRHRPGQWPIRIDAGLAFGTGQHATTAGCIRAASRLAKRHRARRILDTGTGSGLLLIAAHRLHARAQLTGADLDPIAVAVARENGRLNGIALGERRGMARFIAAPGTAHRLIGDRAPYDLVFANILAGPLVALSGALSAAVAHGGHLVLAGLLEGQAQRLIACYGNHGLVLVQRSRRAAWPVLVFRKTRPAARRSGFRAARRETAGRAWTAD